MTELDLAATFAAEVDARRLRFVLQADDSPLLDQADELAGLPPTCCDNTTRPSAASTTATQWCSSAGHCGPTGNPRRSNRTQFLVSARRNGRDRVISISPACPDHS